MNHTFLQKRYREDEAGINVYYNQTAKEEYYPSGDGENNLANESVGPQFVEKTGTKRRICEQNMGSNNSKSRKQQQTTNALINSIGFNGSY